MDTQGAQASRLIRPLVPVALVTSGLIHLILTPEHLKESLILGVGFAIVATLQLAFGVLLLRPRRYIGAAALILVVFSLAVYLIVRLAGLPLGHGHEGGPAPIELVCKGAEMLAIAGLLLSIDLKQLPLPGARRSATQGRPAYLLAFVMSGLIAAVIASYSASGLMAEQDHAHPHDHSVSGGAHVHGVGHKD